MKIILTHGSEESQSSLISSFHKALNQTYALFVLLALLSSSCDKEDKTPVNPTAPTGNYIICEKFQKDTLCYSVNAFTTNMNSFCDKLPIPNDSTAFIELDIDKDSKMDFRISVLHYQIYPTDYCGHCNVHYYKSVKIKPLSQNGFISQEGYAIRTYDSTEIIKKDHIWSNAELNAALLACPPGNFDFNNSFWGLKQNNKLAWLRVKRIGDYGLGVRAYAYNTLNDSPIAAGQEK